MSVNVGVHIDHVTMTAHYTSCKQASKRQVSSYKSMESTDFCKARVASMAELDIETPACHTPRSRDTAYRTPICGLARILAKMYM